MEPPSGPAWTAGQVAQQLGISESTLRTWHRRYGLDPRDAEPGHYRRYRAEDVARLRRMLELINGGMLASEAARTVQDGAPASVPPARDVADLVAAARALDTERCGFLLDGLFTRRGVVDAWEAGLPPGARGRGRRPQRRPRADRRRARPVVGAARRAAPASPAPGRPGAALVLLACTEDEQHTLPLAALSAALGRGPGAEPHAGRRDAGRAAWSAPCARRKPDAVVLWAQRPETASAGALRALRRYPVAPAGRGPGLGSPARRRHRAGDDPARGPGGARRRRPGRERPAGLRRTGAARRRIARWRRPGAVSFGP